MTAVQDPRPTELRDVGDGRNRLAVHLHVEQDRAVRQVGVPQVVMDRLIGPLERTGVDVERDDRVRPEVGSGAARVPRHRVTGPEDHEAVLRVDRRGSPTSRRRRSSSRVPDHGHVLPPGWLWVGMMFQLHRRAPVVALKRHHLVARASAVSAAECPRSPRRCSTSASPRGGCPSATGPPYASRRQLPFALVQRDDLAVTLAEEDQALTERDAGLPAARPDVEAGIEGRRVRPEQVAVRRVVAR